MEILVSVGMIIFAIAFFYVYFLASAILFCDAPVSLIGALFFILLFVSDWKTQNTYWQRNEVSMGRLYK